MSNKKEHHPVIANAWAKMVKTPGLGQRTGKEEIIDKMWITDKGEVIHHGMTITHQEYALRYLKENEKFKSSGDENADILRAEDILLKRGWIRGQAYSLDGLGLQGVDEAIKSYGHLALQIVPEPRRLYVMSYPSNEVTMYGADQTAELFGSTE